MTAPDALGLGRLLPGPGWLVIDAARAQRFTGEVVLLADEAVRIYFDRGRVYLAERSSDPPLSARLVESGALSEQQLEYGRLQVRDADHLGRLFDRVPNVSRDSVITVTDLMNEHTLAWLANQQVQSAGVAPYRYHSSGLHHWLDSAAPPLAAPWPAPTLTIPVSPPADPLDPAPAARPAEAPAAEASAAPAPPPPAAPEPEPPAPAEPVADATLDEIVTWDVPDPFDNTAPSRYGAARAADPGDPGAADEPATEFFGVIWPTGEVDDLAGLERTGRAPVTEPTPAPVPDPAPAPAAAPAAPAPTAPPSDDAGTLAVRRAVATIDTGSLAARRRLLESTQPAAPPVMAEPTSVFDQPVGAEPRPVVDPAETPATDERDAEHQARAQALRRMIKGLRRE